MRAPVHHTRAGMEASKGVKEGKISAPGAGTIKAVPLRDQRHRLQPQKRRKTMAAHDTRSGPPWQGGIRNRGRQAGSEAKVSPPEPPPPAGAGGRGVASGGTAARRGGSATARGRRG